MPDLVEVINRFSTPYIKNYHPPGRVRGVLALIAGCRTAAMGARMYRCENCGHEVPVYNSCGNRHCPGCLGARRVQWVEQREQELLPLPYFHMVFTLPHELHHLIRAHRKELYNLLFATVAETLGRFGADPRHRFEGQLGFLSVLHTWDRTLGYHPHLHVIIPAGALSADRTELHTPRRGQWIFPVRALSNVFRGIYLEKLKALQKAGSLGDAELDDLFKTLYRKSWVVYAKAPFGGPAQLLRYLARYVHRVAISNQRILSVSDTTVAFSYRDRNAAQPQRTMHLDGVEFLRRFADHILPKGFTRVRFYGFWSNSLKGRLLPLIRNLIGADASHHTKAASQPDRGVIEPKPHICPDCGIGRLLPDLRLHPSTGPPKAT